MKPTNIKITNVTVNTGTISALDYAQNVPKEQWGSLIISRRSHTARGLTAACRDLLRFVDEALELKMWQEVGYTNLAEFFRDGLGINSHLISLALDALHELSPNEAKEFERKLYDKEKGESLRRGPEK
jgi:hypothetical protein